MLMASSQAISFFKTRRTGMGGTCMQHSQLGLPLLGLLSLPVLPEVQEFPECPRYQSLLGNPSLPMQVAKKVFLKVLERNPGLF